MKIVLFADYYDYYLKNYYRQNSYAELSYEEHLEKLLDDYFGSFVSYYRHFKELGHDVKLIIGNDYILQNKWLSENHLNLKASKTTKNDIVLEQIRLFGPDVFFMGSMFEYYGKFLADVSKITKNIFTWIACPYPKNLDFSNVSCVISSADFLVQQFRRKGLKSEELHAAFDPEIIKHLTNTKHYELSFIGGLQKTTHSIRVKSIENLIKGGVKIDLFGYGLKKPFWPWDSRTLYSSYHRELWGIEMYQALASSKMTLNFHIDMAQGFAGNMRLYEATGCGTLLLTEASYGLEEKFVPGREIIAYTDISDLKKKISYFNNNPEEANFIALQGQKACLQRHGYDKRILDFENILHHYTR